MSIENIATNWRISHSGLHFLVWATLSEPTAPLPIYVGWTSDSVVPMVNMGESDLNRFGAEIGHPTGHCSLKLLNQALLQLGKRRAGLLAQTRQERTRAALDFFGEAIEQHQDASATPESRAKLRSLLNAIDEVHAWDKVKQKEEAARKAAEARRPPPSVAEYIALTLLHRVCPAYQVTIHEVIAASPLHPHRDKQRAPGWYTDMRLVGSCPGVAVLRANVPSLTRYAAITLATRNVEAMRLEGQIVTIGADGLESPKKPAGGAALNPWVVVPDTRSRCVLDLNGADDTTDTPAPESALGKAGARLSEAMKGAQTSVRSFTTEAAPKPTVFIGVDVCARLAFHAMLSGARVGCGTAGGWPVLVSLARRFKKHSPVRIVVAADPDVAGAQAFADEMNASGIPTYLIRCTKPPAGVSPNSFKVDHTKKQIILYKQAWPAKRPQEVFAAVAANMTSPPPKPAEVWCVEYLRGDRVGYVASVNGGPHYRPWTTVELRDLKLTSDLDKARGFRSEAHAAEYASGSDLALRACECQEALPPLTFDADTAMVDEVDGPLIDRSKLSFGRCEVFIGEAGKEPTTSIGVLAGPIVVVVAKPRANVCSVDEWCAQYLESREDTRWPTDEGAPITPR